MWGEHKRMLPIRGGGWYNTVTGEKGYFDMSKDYDSVAIFSGGLDSTTLVHVMLDQGMTPHLLSFDYGQRHKVELTYASNTALRLGLRHDIVDLTGITHLISNSALTSGPRIHLPADESIGGLAGMEWKSVDKAIEVPEGHYAQDSMKQTVVPNRNMIMLSIAAGVAVNNSYRCIGTGVHAGDHFIYPDCRPKFIHKLGQAIKTGNEGFHNFYVNYGLKYELEDKKRYSNQEIQGDEGIQPIFAPFLERDKADIAFAAITLNVPLHQTWSCYKGGEQHCGRCGTCVERIEAIHNALTLAHPDFDQAGVEEAALHVDKTQYADREFWKGVVKRA